MARSHHVYVVIGAGGVRAAFTVKHELISWLKRHHQTGPYVVTRLSDGDHGDPHTYTEEDIRKYIEDWP